MFDQVKVYEADICTLVPEFTRDEWRKICWFESRFSKVWDNTNVDFEGIIRIKFQQLQSLQSLLEFKEIGQRLRSTKLNKKIQNLHEMSGERFAGLKVVFEVE